jgi:predicted 3-demethylubiquinone-9 3-methyltransferase (glyoxalase superfamily)
MAKVSAAKVTPCLWFDNNAQEAVKYYTSVFKKSKIIELHPVMSTFEIEGQRLMALNGGPAFQFTEAISLYLSCKNQAEVDYYWQTLTADGGSGGQCGWLKDRFGLSWQIVPEALGELMSDPQKAEKVMAALLKMNKIIMEDLKKAAEG